MHRWFFFTNLSFYVRSGRIFKAAGAIRIAKHLDPALNA